MSNVYKKTETNILFVLMHSSFAIGTVNYGASGYASGDASGDASLL
jgi:hypothetical protein